MNTQAMNAANALATGEREIRAMVAVMPIVVLVNALRHAAARGKLGVNKPTADALGSA